MLKYPQSPRQSVLWHSEMSSFEACAMRCSPPLHSSMDFETTSNSHTHTQPGLLIAYFSSTMSQSFQVKQSGTPAAKVHIIKVTSTRLEELTQSRLHPPRRMPSTHILTHGGQNALADTRVHTNRATLPPVCWQRKFWWTEGARCGHQMTRQLLDFKQPDGVTARWFLEEQRWWQWWWHQDDEDVEEEDRTGEIVKRGDESTF